MAPSSRRFKDGIFEQLARLGGALSAPKRIELLDLLCHAPRTVEALAAQAATSAANASQHLQLLRAARLVEAEKKGLHVEYRLASAEVRRFCVALHRLAEVREIRARTSSGAAPWRRSTAPSFCAGRGGAR